LDTIGVWKKENFVMNASTDQAWMIDLKLD
jgi:hypothetical protein